MTTRLFETNTGVLCTCGNNTLTVYGQPYFCVSALLDSMYTRLVASFIGHQTSHVLLTKSSIAFHMSTKLQYNNVTILGKQYKMDAHMQ